MLWCMIGMAPWVGRKSPRNVRKLFALSMSCFFIPFVMVLFRSCVLFYLCVLFRSVSIVCGDGRGIPDHCMYITVTLPCPPALSTLLCLLFPFVEHTMPSNSEREWWETRVFHHNEDPKRKKQVTQSYVAKMHEGDCNAPHFRWIKLTVVCLLSAQGVRKCRSPTSG